MNLDPELKALEQMAMPDFGDVQGVRNWVKALLANAPPLDPALSKGVELSEQMIPGPANAPQLRVRLYRPRVHTPAPALLYFHSGSFLMGDLNTDHVACLNYARDSQCVVVSVEYRLAPENPFPAGLEDGYAALQWLHAQSKSLGIDPARIAVGGASAGGALAGGLAILARDRAGPRPMLQMLVYPPLDDRMTSRSLNSGAPTCVLPRAVVGYMWRHYLGGSGIAASPYAAPSRLADLSGLANAYIETCELDPLRDEVIDYAARLLNGGISVDFHLFAGAPHGFDVILDAAVTKRAFATRAAVLRKAFGLSAN